MISLLGLYCNIAVGLPWNGAQVTAFVQDETYTHDLSPKPTPAPAVLFRRQSRGLDTCGFIDGDLGDTELFAYNDLFC